jgi:hypothetical protein
MFKLNRERAPCLPSSPVDALLFKVEDFDKEYHSCDDYIHRIRDYLHYAKRCGLDSQSVVDSCVDLAETYTDVSEVVEMRQSKLDAWKSARDTALLIGRAPMEIDMELDPIYFEAILRGSKTYEGRAYKPGSDKNYPAIRSNDRIRFRLSNRKEGFAEEAVRRGLSPYADMLCTVKEIYFAPTVHGMYQIPRFNGLGFQPMIDGPSEMLQLQRAAVYHTFPGYHELIGEHGFLGIQVENPHLIMAA